MLATTTTSYDDKQSYDYWLKKNNYYHTYVAKMYRSCIARGQTILQLGCKNGFILPLLDPSYAIGVDDDAECIKSAQTRYPAYRFFTNLSDVPVQSFDIIILSLATMETDDVQLLLDQLHHYCSRSTRIIVDTYSCLWEPILWISQKLGLRRATPLKNWLSARDLYNFFSLSDYQLIQQLPYLLLPVYIPGISWFFNKFCAPLPFINYFCLGTLFVTRSCKKSAYQDPQRVSVIIPCRNERGNVEAAIQRCPTLGEWTEFIFVEGHSQDDTLAEIQRVQQAYPEKNISYYVQPGIGKADAVYTGFAHAQGNIFFILDADLTTPPEEMPKFLQALSKGAGECINGSRLVYATQSGAFRFLNMVANYGFACIFSWLLRQPIKDTLCGTKVLFKEDYLRIMQQRLTFGCNDPFGDFDILFGAAKLHLKIIDVPVHYKNRTYGTTQIHRFRHGLMLARMCWHAFCMFTFRP